MNVTEEMVQSIMRKKIKAAMGAKTCTQIAKMTKQPRGGYINPMDMVCEDMADDEYRAELVDNMDAENLAANVVGVAVDYLLRYTYEAPSYKGDVIDMECLRVPRHGVRDGTELDLKRFRDVASRMSDGELDDDTIDAMCMLTAWDTMYRSGMPVDPDTLHPDAITTKHIRMMVMKSREMMGKVPDAIGPTFEGGMPMKIHSADADYIRDEWLVDMKVSKKEVPDKIQTLQLAMYFIMGKYVSCDYNSNPYRSAFENMQGVEILNPRCGVRWRYHMRNMSKETITEIKEKVMGGFDPCYV